MVTLQGDQGRASLTHLFNFFLIFRHSGTQNWAPECPNVKKLKGRLDQYGLECFSGLTFATIRKSVGLKGLTEV